MVGRFGSANCADGMRSCSLDSRIARSICPAAMFKMKLLTESIEKSGQKPPAVVLISVDGERDTPEVMKKYLAGYSESFIGLTGDPRPCGRSRPSSRRFSSRACRTTMPATTRWSTRPWSTWSIRRGASGRPSSTLRSSRWPRRPRQLSDPGAVTRELSPCRGGRATCAVGPRRTRRCSPGHTGNAGPARRRDGPRTS